MHVAIARLFTDEEDVAAIVSVKGRDHRRRVGASEMKEPVHDLRFMLDRAPLRSSRLPLRLFCVLAILLLPVLLIVALSGRRLLPGALF